MYETVYCVLLVFVSMQCFCIGYIVGEGQRKLDALERSDKE